MSRVRADQYTNNAGTGSPLFTHGVRVTGVATATSFDGNLTGNVTGNADTATYAPTAGIATYAPTAGIATNAQGLTGTPDLNVGVVTATEFSGDGSNLDNIKSGITTFVASGAISNGNTVVINTNGTVSAVTGSGSVNPSVGISSVFEEASADFISVAYDSTNNKVVVAYRDTGNSSYGTAVVGTVNGTDIEFGTPVVFEEATTTYISAVYDYTNNKIVIAYSSASNNGLAIVGSVSGNSITFSGGTPTPSTFKPAQTNWISAVHDPNSNKIVIAYSSVTNSSRGEAIVGTIDTSNDTIDFSNSSNTVIYTTNNKYISTVYEPIHNKIVFVYEVEASPSYAMATIGTVDGDSITFGNTTRWYDNSSADYVSAAYDSANDRIVIAFAEGGSSIGKAIVGNVSGNAIYFGNPVVFESNSTSHISTLYDPTYQRIVISYRDNDNTNGKSIVGNVEFGTTIDFDDPISFDVGDVSYISTIYDSTNKKAVIAYQDVGYNFYGTGVVLSPVSLTTNLTEENYIGIAAEGIADGETGKVNIIGGINASQTGLTTAQKYYANPLGGLSLNPIVPAGGSRSGIPIIVAGTSISDTSIIVNGEDDSNSSAGDSGGVIYGDNNVDAHLNRDGTVGVSSVLGWNGNDYNWQPPGGAWELISTVTASNASTVDFTSGIDNTYRQYVILGSEITGGHLYMQFYVNGSIHQSGYRYSHGYFYDYSVGHPVDYMWVETGGGSYLQLTGTSSDRINNPTIVKVTIDNPSASKSHYTVDWDLTGGDASDGSNTNYKLFGSGSLESSTALTNVNGVRFYYDSGTVSGTFKLYGIK